MCLEVSGLLKTDSNQAATAAPRGTWRTSCATPLQDRKMAVAMQLTDARLPTCSRSWVTTTVSRSSPRWKLPEPPDVLDVMQPDAADLVAERRSDAGPVPAGLSWSPKRPRTCVDS